MKNSKFNNFYIRSSVFGILSLAGAVLNYALYPILTRILSAKDFGDFAAIVSISNQVLGVLLAFNIISMYLVKSHPENDARNHTQTIQKVLIWSFILITSLVFVSSPVLGSLLKIGNLASFLALVVMLLVAVPIVIWTGYLQGHNEMIRIGVFNVGSSLSKLMLASVLALTLGATGSIWGLVGGGVAGLIILNLFTGIKLPQLSSIFHRMTHEEKRFIYSLKGYFIECILVVGGLSILQNFDITLAKILFSSETAGIYSGISILSNALYYLSFLLIWVILPEIKINSASNNRRILSRAYALLGLLAIFALTFEYVFLDRLSGILLGPAFASQGTTLLFATIYQLSLAAVTLYIFYLLVCRKKRGSILGGLVFGLVTIIPSMYASNPSTMIQLMCISVATGTIIYFVGLKIFELFPKRTS